MEWLSGDEERVVVQGDDFDFVASFVSSVRIPNAHWWASGGLQPLFGATGSPTPIGDVEPHAIYTIQRRVHVPEDLPPGLYAGNIQIYHHRESGNSTLRVYPHVLPVKVYVVRY